MKEDEVYKTGVTNWFLPNVLTVDIEETGCLVVNGKARAGACGFTGPGVGLDTGTAAVCLNCRLPCP